MSKKVYIVSWNGMSSAGGVERVVYYLNEILKEKNDVIIVDFEKMKSLNIYKFFKFLFKDNSIILYSMLSSFYIWLKKDKNSIVISNGINASFIKSDYLFLHGSASGHLNKLEGRLIKYNKGSLLEMLSGHFAKRLISVSALSKKEWIKFYKIKSNKIKVLNNCVDSNIFYPIKKEQTEKIRIIFCGRLEDGKGVYKLLSLAKNIEFTDEFQMIIATNSNQNIELFNNLKNTKILIGLEIDRLNEFYNEADVFYFPSIYEGFEMVTLESLSAGVPIVGNEVGAIAELSRRHFSGVTVINTDVDTDEEILKILRKQAMIFMDYNIKNGLHYQIKKYFDISIYIKKLRILLSNMI